MDPWLRGTFDIWKQPNASSSPRSGGGAPIEQIRLGDFTIEFMEAILTEPDLIQYEEVNHKSH